MARVKAFDGGSEDGLAWGIKYVSACCTILLVEKAGPHINEEYKIQMVHKGIREGVESTIPLFFFYQNHFFPKN